MWSEEFPPCAMDNTSVKAFPANPKADNLKVSK